MDRRKAEKEEKIYEQLSHDFYITRACLRCKAGVSYAGLDGFVEENEDKLRKVRVKTSLGSGRAEIAYKLK